ncbi:MAG TPA: undecaprenyl-diphosphate phosphatase, partial [Candidatus Cloacimonadota bacterium]|nr:undecaprenyl-diphosphate phosphatase [Candidatus Cloacimonadota bacterium]
GHLVLLQHFLKLETSSDVAFEVFLHLGTLLAVLIYFRKMIIDLVISLFKWKDSPQNQAHRYNRALIMYILAATLGTGIVYWIFGDIFKTLYGKPLIVAFMLLITGAIVFASDYMKGGSIPAVSMGLIRSVIIGLVHGIAIIPGISRSGSTIGASLFAGLKRKDAASFSFLLSIPAILAANLKEFKALASLQVSALFIFLAGFIAAFVVAYLVISLLINMIQRGNLKYFAFYCWGVGLLSIILLVS